MLSCAVHACCAVLCCAVLCCAVLCCAVLCCAVLCCAVLCCPDSMAVWQGLFLKGSLVHGEHRFEFPVFMTREPDLRTFLLAYLGPPLLSYTLNTLLVRPLWRHHRRKKVCPHPTLTNSLFDFFSIYANGSVYSPPSTCTHPTLPPPNLPPSAPGHSDPCPHPFLTLVGSALCYCTVITKFAFPPTSSCTHRQGSFPANPFTYAAA